MIKTIAFCSLLLLCTCSPKYEVIQSLYHNEFDESDSEIKYHLENVKNRSIVIVKAGEILTDGKLKEGDIVKLKPKKERKGH